MEWPDWWEWDIEVSSHCGKRMHERVFNETDLRAILSEAIAITEQAHGTFVVSSSHENKPWEVIVVPDFEKQLIVVISAYPLS